MQIITTNNNFKISFKYNPYLVEKVKALPGRRFDPIDKVWLVPIQYKSDVEHFARINHFEFSGHEIEVEQVFEIPPLPELTINIPLKMSLFPYQTKGVAYALQKKRLIIGDSMGLGKTAEAIATMVAANAFPCLVICPNSLKINWSREWELWTGRKFTIILDNNVRKNYQLYYESGMAKVFIVNYESLKKYFVKSINKKEDEKLRLNHIIFDDRIKMFKSVIIDESHRCKNLATQQTKFTKGICNEKEWILCLTGTPVINKPKDLISQLGIINAMDFFGKYANFVRRYCNGPNEASNLRELNYKLNLNCFFRRDKKEVLTELPPKLRQVIICDIDNRHEYTDAENDLINYLREYKEASDEQIQKSMRGEIMVRIGILKNISARGKLNDVYDFIDDVLENGEKLVVFAHLKEIIGAIRKHYPKGTVSITGDDSIPQRQQAIDSFQNISECKLILCSIKAAGVGVTLTASSRVAFIEQSWSAADHEQCEDRCHRIGQKDSVQCTYFLGKNTIDEHIYKIIDSKRNMANMITGSSEQVETNIVDAIANLFNQKP